MERMKEVSIPFKYDDDDYNKKKEKMFRFSFPFFFWFVGSNNGRSCRVAANGDGDAVDQ